MTALWDYFDVLLERQRVIKGRHARYARKFQALLDKQLTVWQQQHKRKKVPDDIKQALTDPLLARLGSLSQQWEPELTAIKARIFYLATVLEYVPLYLSTFNLIKRSYSTTYSRQGLGANTYARGILQVKAELYNKFGYLTKIVELESLPNRNNSVWSTHLPSVTYGLYVNARPSIEQAIGAWTWDTSDVWRGAGQLNVKVWFPGLPNKWE